MSRFNWDGLRQLGSRAFGWDGAFWVASIVGVSVIGGVLSWVFWDCLHDGEESLSSTIRNLALVIGGVDAALLAVWRSTVAQRKADTADQYLLNERYQRGAEMLGSDVLAVRLGGIYALQRLAEEHPQQYHIRIMRLFCAFIRNPTVENRGETGQGSHETGEAADTHKDDSGIRPRQDVEAIMEAIATRIDAGIEIEAETGFRCDFRKADLCSLDLYRTRGANFVGVILTDANLAGIRLSPGTDLSSVKDGYAVNLSKARLNGVSFTASNLWEADLSNSLLIRSDLQDADLSFADLSGATLANANMSGADLRGSILSGTKFAHDDYPPARGLTQDQIDKARADKDNPPKLDGVLDAYTGKQLVWRGKPLDDTLD